MNRMSCEGDKAPYPELALGQSAVAPPPTRQAPPGAMHLVSDEPWTVLWRGAEHDHRMRLWMHRDNPAVIVVDSGTPGIPTSIQLSYMINGMYEGILRHWKGGFHFFVEFHGLWYAVRFVKSGVLGQLRFSEPTLTKSDLKTVESLVRQRLEAEAVA